MVSSWNLVCVFVYKTNALTWFPLPSNCHLTMSSLTSGCGPLKSVVELLRLLVEDNFTGMEVGWNSRVEIWNTLVSHVSVDSTLVTAWSCSLSLHYLISAICNPLKYPPNESEHPYTLLQTYRPKVLDWKWSTETRGNHLSFCFLSIVTTAGMNLTNPGWRCRYWTSGTHTGTRLPPDSWTWCTHPRCPCVCTRLPEPTDTRQNIRTQCWSTLTTFQPRSCNSLPTLRSCYSFKKRIITFFLFVQLVQNWLRWQGIAVWL